MAKCERCNRELTDNGTVRTMGDVCRAKAERDALQSDAKKAFRVERLRNTPEMRVYLVFDSPRRRVRVANRDGAKFADCECQTAAEMCEHIAQIAGIETAGK